MRLSIRWRLTLWNILALAVVLVGFGALVYALLTQVHERIDRALRARVDHALQRVDESLHAELETLQQDRELASDLKKRLRYWIYEFQEHEKIFCVVYDSAGKVYQRTEQLAADSVPPAPPVKPGEIRYEIGRAHV